MSTAAAVLERCAALGRISEEPDRLVRRYATPAMREAYELVGGWMRDAGLAVREDAVGNLIGRRDGPGKTLVLGSHLDTVVNAGRYDGPLGVLAALAVLERLWDRALPFAIELIGFADEEGVRYGTTFLGSSAVAGRFAPAWLALEDGDGVTMADALRAFGGDPDAIASAAMRPKDLLGYCEVHIEQGPVLERRGAPVGIVTTITGQTHAEVRFIGEAGHAGTVPMNARRDALAAAAEWMLAVESVARRRQGTVATVGRITVEPGARNVIPGEAWMTLDVRHTSNAVRREAIADLRAEAQRIAAGREVELDWDARGETAAVPTSQDLTDLLADAVVAAGHAPERLPSGAGHDAVAMAALTDVAMLFVRCERGISHNPAEAVAEADVAVALDVLERFLGIAGVIVRGGTVVLPGAMPVVADVAIEDGVFAAIGPQLEPSGEEVDARGLHVLPGAIDAHVHFNEPGRTDWEGWATGTSALAAGGATACVEMPLNAHPPTVDGAAFDAKVAAARASAKVDFALWGGLVPGPLERMDELAERGVAGFKAFMCDTGIDDFDAVDDDQLAAGMERAAALGLPVLVHAERPAELRPMDGSDWRAWVASRPPRAELAAIERAIALADAAGCSLHVVHVSTGAGVAAVTEARWRGADVTCETCPHYLAFCEDDLERLGTLAKCAPPLRPAAERDALWEQLARGRIALVASDHSPCPPAMKDGGFAAAWGGIAGAQSTLSVLLHEGAARRVPVSALAELVTGAPARRFGLPKGRLEPGADADLALVDLRAEHAAEPHDRHRANPFAGRPLRTRVVRTLLRGQTIYEDGRVAPGAHGRVLKPGSTDDP